jgi:hypothetical protein
MNNFTHVHFILCNYFTTKGFPKPGSEREGKEGAAGKGGTPGGKSAIRSAGGK